MKKLLVTATLICTVSSHAFAYKYNNYHQNNGNSNNNRVNIVLTNTKTVGQKVICTYDKTVGGRFVAKITTQKPVRLGCPNRL